MAYTTKLIAFIIAVVTIPLVLGAVSWARTFNLKMTWWKWLLLTLWYSLLIFFILVDFNIIEKGTGLERWKMLLLQFIIMVAFGAGLGRILWKGRLKSR